MSSKNGGNVGGQASGEGIKVPLMNTVAEHGAHRMDIEAVVAEVLNTGDYVNGPRVAAFEQEFAEYCDACHAIGVGNGTDALRIALSALNVGPGDEVVTVSHSFIATVEAIVHVGATPVFVEVGADDATMDVHRLADAITDKTAAIVPVHLYGRPVDMDAVMDVASAHGIAVIEDACQAHGATYKGRRVGSLGDIGCFSFYPTKNLGAAGDGGAITTCSGELAERIRLIANHGSAVKYQHEIIGWNSRLDELQAAILSIKLRKLDAENERRSQIAHRYMHNLQGINDLLLPAQADEENTNVYHLFVVRHKQRDSLSQELNRRGVGTGVHYPTAIHQQQAFSDHYRHWVLPVSEAWAAQGLSLPMYPQLTDAEVDFVCEQTRQAVAGLVNV